VPDPVITIDGSWGEGGGQVLRTSLGLAAALGLSVRVINVRARRDRPGLRPQHLSAVRAAAAVCGGTLEGDAIGSGDLTLRPGDPRHGEYRFDIGTAGASTLVLQTVIPALLLAGGESDVTVTGGTHNPLAPCFDYLRDVFGVLAMASGVDMHLEMKRAGFYPAGGGEVRMRLAGLDSVDDLAPLRYNDRGELRSVEVLSAASFSLPAHIIERQAHQASDRLIAAGHHPRVAKQMWETPSPGTAVFVRAVFARGVAGWCALGARVKPAEAVADEAVDGFLAFLSSAGAVDAHAADQLLTIAALCPGESRFTAQAATSHVATNAEVIRQLVGREIEIAPADGGAAVVTVKAV
jgi:RNA 3'-terminal phosphate cyclase (ATP)